MPGGSLAGPWAGTVAVVTGATSGLGVEIAFGLARSGATTVVVGRGEDRARDAARAIAARSGNPLVESVGVSDLALRAEQRRLAEVLASRYPAIGILVNNAGGIFTRRDVTSEGLERTFALNVLAPFVLTERLAAPLRGGRGGRVVNLSSGAHRGQRLVLDDLQMGRRYSGWTAYGRSKLALLLLTREFARRFGAAGPTVNAVHPGFVRTGFAQNNGGWTARFVRIAGRVGGRTPEHGAETPIYVATEPSLSGVTGQYFADRRIRPGSVASRDPATASGLFDAVSAIATA